MPKFTFKTTQDIIKKGWSAGRIEISADTLQEASTIVSKMTNSELFDAIIEQEAIIDEIDYVGDIQVWDSNCELLN